MSGGHWGYLNDNLANVIFNWRLCPDYGKDGFSQAKQAARMNPLEDNELSELLWDMLCLLHSYDWYVRGDTSEERYLEDAKYFKNKWLRVTPTQRRKSIIDKAIERAREDIYKSLEIEQGEVRKDD